MLVLDFSFKLYFIKYAHSLPNQWQTDQSWEIVIAVAFSTFLSVCSHMVEHGIIQYYHSMIIYVTFTFSWPQRINIRFGLKAPDKTNWVNQLIAKIGELMKSYPINEKQISYLQVIKTSCRCNRILLNQDINQ